MTEELLVSNRHNFIKVFIRIFFRKVCTFKFLTTEEPMLQLSD